MELSGCIANSMEQILVICVATKFEDVLRNVTRLNVAHRSTAQIFDPLTCLTRRAAAEGISGGRALC